MLTSLSIKNFALIEELEMTFSNQFSIITGETGAGKSILLGALGLILGNRADLTSLKDKEQKCVIEATFSLQAYGLQSFFESRDLDYDDLTIIRREILPSGKSRAFINDSPVNLEELKDLGIFLIDIHSQHQTRELSNEDYQLEIIDAIAQNKSILDSYKLRLSVYKASKSKLHKLISEKESITKEAEFNTFLLQELLDSNLKEGEQESLETTYETLNNVEFIKENLDKSLSIAKEENIGVIQSLKEIKGAIHKIAPIASVFQDCFERISSVLIEFDDIISELEVQSERVVSDPEKLELVNQKLQQIYTLQKKHNVNTVSELLQIQNDLDSKVLLADDLDNQIQKLEQQLKSDEAELDALANTITKNRQNAIPVLVEKLSEILSELGMPNARFLFEIKPSESYLSNGKDLVELQFSANKGTHFGLLKKVASGGEMSRIMLAVKSILAEYSKLPTIIFDEIDTGVSGEIALKMGDIMKKMSRKMQVFAITHLPQIAAKGNQHYKVYKSETGNSTISELILLSEEKRIVEIAEMLSGKEISESALLHAKELLR